MYQAIGLPESLRNETEVGGGGIIYIKNVTEEKSHIFVKDIERSSEKIFKYQFFTYVNILGPERNKKI